MVDYIREELKMMTTCANCQKRIIVRLVLTILDIKPSELAKQLNLSESLVSKYIAGDRKSKELDLFFIGQIFDVEIKKDARSGKLREKIYMG